MTAPLVILSPEELEDIVADAVERGVRAARIAPALVGWRDAGIPAKSWRHAVRTGQLAAVKIGRCYLAAPKAIEAWLATQNAKASTTAAANDDDGAGDELDRALARGSR